LSVHEVVTVFEALNFGKCKEALISGEIDGKCLMKCSTEDDVKGIGISLSNVKASVIIDEIRQWKASGVPREYISVDRATIRENNDAEDMIDEMKVDNHEDRKTNDDVRVAAFVDSTVMQGETGSNDNDHQGSVLDDTSTIESVVGSNDH